MPITFLSTGESLAKRAMKAARRAKTGELRKLAELTEKEVEGSVLVEGPTADWRFDADKHMVRLGDRFHTQITVDNYESMRKNDQRAMKLAAAILRHERWHGLVTVRDVNALGAECRRLGVPFRVFNMLEDVRIEAKAVSVEGSSFEWRTWIAVTDATSPFHALFNMKLNGSRWGHMAYWRDATDADRDCVTKFYSRAADAANSWEIVKLAEEWVKQWGDEGAKATEEMVQHGQAQDAIGDEIDGSISGGAAPATLPDAPSAEGDLGVKVDENGKAIDPVAPKTGPKQKHWTEYTSSMVNTVDTVKADRLASKLSETLVAAVNESDRQMASSGSRLHIGNAASGSDQPFTTHTSTGGAPKMVLVMDMSGSMGHDFAAHAQSFIGAMLRLIRRGDIEGSVWLTGGNGHAYVPPTTDDRKLSHFCANEENETVADTLDAIKHHVTGADVVVVYTDGDLTDRCVNAGEWRARGVDLVGAIVAHASVSEWRSRNMVKHFGRAVIGQTGIELANKLVAYVGTRTRAK